MSDSAGTFDDWMDDFERAYDSPDELQRLACRGCAARSLRLVFVVDEPGTERGTAAFWCDACLRGLIPLRVLVPDGATAVLRGRESIPNYKLIVDHSESGGTR